MMDNGRIHWMAFKFRALCGCMVVPGVRNAFEFAPHWMN